MSSSGAGAGESTGAPASDPRWWQIRRRAVLLAWAVLVVVLWNVVFDWVVIQSGRDYLTQQALHQQGAGAAVTIPGVMRPGIVRGFWLATLVAGGVAASGVLLFWAAAWQQRWQEPRRR
jgi:hypothetical protein